MKRTNTWLRSLAGLLGRVLFGVVYLWVLGAIWYSGLLPSPAPRILAVGVAVAIPLAWYRLGNHRAVATWFVVLAALVMGLWQLKRPRADRAWVRELARQPAVEVQGSSVRIAGIRDCRYRTPEDFDLRYVDRVFDLDRLDSVDFLVERFSDLDGLAHTLLTFGFEGGEHVAVSVELRREEGESFHPVAGLFRQFELTYVIGTERDLIALRTNHRQSRVWLFPIRTTPEQRRSLFLSMLDRAAALQREPEFYNSLTSSCTTNIVDHVHELVPGRIPLSLRVTLPGYAGSLAYELGLIDTDLEYEEAEAAYRIDPVAQAGGDGPGFSARIRAGRP